MNRIVVNGASGQIGSLIVEELARKVPVETLTLVTRTPEKLAHWARRGACVCAGDYTDKASLKSAYAGCDTLMMISGTNILKRVTEHANAIEAAREAGIGHIVYTSCSGVHPRNRTPSSTDHTATEALLRTSGVGYTCLRNQAYAEFATMMAEAPLRTGTWYFIGENALYSPVTRADISLCAANILREPERHRDVTYEITGPELLSFKQLSQRFAQMYDRPIDYVSLDREGMWQMFDAWGAQRVGNPGASDPLSCFGSNEPVENYAAWDEMFHAVVSHHVEFITGKKPTSLHEVMLADKPAMMARLQDAAMA